MLYVGTCAALAGNASFRTNAGLCLVYTTRVDRVGAVLDADHLRSRIWLFITMTRCLDCGSERTTDQCPSCGLTTAAAEVMFRRHLMARTGIFLLGSLAFPYISQIYPPLDLDWILVFFGVIFFGALTLAIILERRARNHQEIEILKRIYNGFIPLPWILAATLFINGRLDLQKNVVYHPTSVEGHFNMKGIVKGSRRLFVRSWRPGQRTENLAVDLDDYDRFREGDAVVVGVEPGALGIPWYYGVYRR